MTSTEAGLAENLGPFSEIFNASHYISKIKNVKTLECNLRLLDMTDFDDRHLYELVLMSNY